MFKKVLNMILPCATLIAVNGCVDYYQPLALETDYNLLVVDGFFNNGTDSTVINLSHSQTLNGTDQRTVENGAIVQIESEAGGVYILTNHHNGNYTLPHTIVDNATKYRLTISIGNKEYASEYVTPLLTSVIDSVSWKLTKDGPRDGISVYVNTHGNEENSIYYLWSYDETWEYTSRYTSSFQMVGDTIIPRTDNIFYCWHSEPSTGIFAGTSAALNENIIKEFQLRFIPLNSPRLSRRYSLRVQQFSLNRGAYDYWLAMQKNTEELGSLFGPLPYQGMGNIHCTSNADETVIGYFLTTSKQQKRLFVNSSQVPTPHQYDNGYQLCDAKYVPVEKADEERANLIIDGVWDFNVLQGYTVSTPYCVDCRLQGGTTARPEYW